MNTSRRELLQSVPAAFLAPHRWRFAICSGTFEGTGFEDACRAAHRIGYHGIEIEPCHLGADPAALSSSERRSVRETVRAAGLVCPAFHSLLKAPAGLHLTTPDGAIRRRSWDYFERIVDLAADIATRAVLVLGSSKQREAMAGVPRADAVMRLTEGLAALAPRAQARGVTILVEPLAPHLCKVVNTLGEAAAILRTVNSPAVQTILDTHNTAGETQSLDDIVRQHLPRIRHVHLNEMDGRRPGAGDFPFPRLLRSLREHGYPGWLSVEVFDFKPDGETVARESLEYLRRIESTMA